MLNSLYQELILDHGRSPRNHRKMEFPTHTQEGHNPLCGDNVTVYVDSQDGVVNDISFLGDGCAICMSSASLMTSALKGLTVHDAKLLFEKFHQMLTTETKDLDDLGKLSALQGVAAYPMRVKCASLPWHAFLAAMNQDNKPASTE